jgi:rod shape-determining protein MreC
MPTVVARHPSFFTLLGVLLAQLLLLSVQITRNQNVRLIHVWAATAFSPFEQGFHSVAESAAQTWDAIHVLWADQEENQALGSQLVVARARIQELSEKAAEADRLRVLLDFKSQLPYRSLAAEVIASSPGVGSTVVSINRGQTSGVTPDLAVVTPAGVVGKVVAVYPQTAQVLLITDPSCGVGCMLEGSRTQGVLKGGGQDQCHLDYVMDEENVPKGEPVLTSGLDQIYPKGLLVGYVVGAETGNIYKHIVVKPAVSLSRLENVLVLLKSGASEQRQAMILGHP